MVGSAEATASYLRGRVVMCIMGYPASSVSSGCRSGLVFIRLCKYTFLSVQFIYDIAFLDEGWLWPSRVQFYQ